MEGAGDVFQLRGVMGELKAGVAGAGVFGGFHAKKYASLEGVRLARVFDVDLDRAKALAEPLGAEAVDDLDTFVAGLDVVTVASPGFTHAEIAARALSVGASVYVEKPLAVTVDDAETLVALAAAQNRVLACGHQELVVFEAMGLTTLPKAPLRLSALRRGTPNTRNRDISCVLDLMIHDLDLALILMGEEAIAVEAEGEFDAVRAEVTFANGATASFEASRIAEARERRFEAVFDEGQVAIDFLAPSFENTTPFALNPNFADSPAAKDPLGVSVTRFLAAVRGEDVRPIASGLDGERALDLALAVEHAAGL